MSNQYPSPLHTKSPKLSDANTRKAMAILRWQCEDMIANSLAPYARHAGLPLARAVASMLQHRLNHIHQCHPATTRTLAGWQHIHMICHMEEAGLIDISRQLQPLPDHARHPDRIKALCQRLAVSILREQVPDYVDGSLHMSLIEGSGPAMDKESDADDAYHNSLLESLEIGNIRFLVQPEIPTRWRYMTEATQDDHWQNDTDHAIDSP